MLLAYNLSSWIMSSLLQYSANRLLKSKQILPMGLSASQNSQILSPGPRKQYLSVTKCRRAYSVYAAKLRKPQGVLVSRHKILFSTKKMRIEQIFTDIFRNLSQPFGSIFLFSLTMEGVFPLHLNSRIHRERQI